jgi:hypothetical protein
MATYTIKNVEMDSIADLEDQGGSVRSLKIAVALSGESYPTVSLEFHPLLRPDLTLFSLDENDELIAHGGSREVLSSRRTILKNLMGELPDGMGFALLFLLPTVDVILTAIPATRHTFIERVFSLAWITYSALFTLATLSSSRIYLVRSHERSKASLESMKKYAVAAGTFLLGLLTKTAIERWFGK